MSYVHVISYTRAPKGNSTNFTKCFGIYGFYNFSFKDMALTFMSFKHIIAWEFLFTLVGFSIYNKQVVTNQPDTLVYMLDVEILHVHQDCLLSSSSTHQQNISERHSFPCDLIKNDLSRTFHFQISCNKPCRHNVFLSYGASIL